MEFIGNILIYIWAFTWYIFLLVTFFISYIITLPFALICKIIKCFNKKGV